MTGSPSCKKLMDWFIAHKRAFPWRENPSPYAVWVSEVMLQQTRASVVVPYFLKWMKRFPTVETLAEAPWDEVLKMWEGLGYYRRALHLHEGAKQLVHGGKILAPPLQNLLKISGIGSYTAGAIASFAFHQKAVAIDANVERVMARYEGIEGDVKKTEVRRLLEEKTLRFLPDNTPWIAMEALIELGATHCSKTPSCHKCPLQESCKAYKYDKIAAIPQSKKKEQTVFLSHQVAIFLVGKEVLLEKQAEGKVLGGLFAFPSFPYDVSIDLEEEMAKKFGFAVSWQEDFALHKQTFTRYRVDLYPSLFFVEQKKEVLGFVWHPLEKVEKELSLNSGHRRILHTLLKKIL